MNERDGAGVRVQSERVHFGDNLEILFHFKEFQQTDGKTQGIMSSDLTHS